MDYILFKATIIVVFSDGAYHTILLVFLKKNWVVENINTFCLLLDSLELTSLCLKKNNCNIKKIIKNQFIQFLISLLMGRKSTQEELNRSFIYVTSLSILYSCYFVSFNLISKMICLGFLRTQTHSHAVSGFASTKTKSF